MKDNRNMIQQKKSDKGFYIAITIVFIIVDVLITLNFSKLQIKYPKDTISERVNRLTEIMQTYKIFSFDFNKDLFNAFIQTQKNLLIAYLVLAMVIIERKTKLQSDFKGIEHGSAEWAKKIDRQRFKNDKNTIVLADGMYLDPKDSKADNLNELLIGGSGAGKSFRKIKPDIMQMSGSYVVTDPKGELYRDTAKLLEKHGYRVKVLNVLSPKFSDGYNPFAYINKEHLESDVLVLVNVFMKNTSDTKKSGGDQFWDDSMKALLTAIIFYLVLEDDETKTFERVFELVRNVVIDEETGDIDASQTELERIFTFIEQTDPFHPGLQAYQEFKLASGKTAKNILISLAVRLNIWINKDICNMTYEDEIEINKIGTEKTAIFLIVPDTDDTFNVLVSIFYTQLFKILFYEADFNHNGRLPYLVNCELDEFANIGEIPNFDKYIATMRSRNVRVTVVVQALSQLEKLYKDSWETILGCCYIINYIGTTDNKTQEFVSKRLGKTTVYVQTEGKSKSSKSSSFSENGSFIGRELLTPDEVNTMDPKNSILMIKGIRPFFCEKFKTQNHPFFKEVGSNFPDGIPNNTNIIKKYSERAERKREEAEERKKSKIEKLKEIAEMRELYQEILNQEEEQQQEELQEKFEENFDE